MTIKLLTPWNGYPALARLSLDSATETGLVNAKQATTDLTGAIAYQPNVPVQKPGQVKIDDATGLINAAGAQAAMGVRRARGSKLITGSMSATAGTTAGSTWAATFALPVPFTHVAPVFLNLETGTIAIAAASAAAVSNLTSFPHSSATFVPVLFGGSASGTMPARAAANQPTPYVGDLTQLASVASDDGSGMYYVHMRAHFAGTGYSYCGLTTNSEASANLFGGQVFRSASQNVNGVAVPTDFTQANASTNTVFVGVIYRSETNVLSFAVGSDSTGRGTGSTTGIAGAAVRTAAALSTPTRPVVAVNMGCAGAIPSVYQANYKRYLAAIPATVAAYRVSSINEPVTTQDIADKHMGLAIDFVDFAWQNRIVPILETCTPQNLGSTSADAFRRALNSRVREYCAANGVMLVDIAAAVEDPAITWQYLPAYNSGDNSHPNDAGYAAMSAAQVAVLSKVFG